jgi:hypothetical protein
MDDIFLSTDIEMITLLSILSIILLTMILVLHLLKDSHYVKDNFQMENLFEKLSYLIFGYIYIIQCGVIYHVNYLSYSFSGSEGNILLEENDESHPIVAFIIILLLIVSLLMTVMSAIKKENKLGEFNQEEIDMLEYSEHP